MDSSTPLSVESAVIFIVFILVLATVLRTSGKMLRRHVFGFARGDELDAAFPTFGYQKFAGRAEVSGLGDFGELYNRLGFNIGGLLHNGWPEIHHLLCDYEDDMVMSLFDLRRPATRSFGARYSSCILLTNPGTRLTPFTLSQETLAHISLWGKDPDIDIERIRAVAAEMKPGERLVADANTGWVQHEAARVVSAVQDVDVYIEQPCLSYEECLAIRRRISHPFVLDESIDGMDVLMRGHADGAMDVVNIKISKFGGLTPARQARDLCVRLGIGMTIEDSWGGDITTAAIAHLAHSTPTELLFTATDFNSYVTVSTAEGAPQRKGGRLAASTEPGLGVVPRADVLGEPVLTID